MRLVKKLMLLFMILMLQGCIVMSSSPVTVSNLVKEVKGPKIVTFMVPTQYVAELSTALAENGFVIKPMLSQQQIYEYQNSKDRVAVFNEATARYGLTLQEKQSGVCAFTEFNLYNFTLMVTDIRNNQIVMVLKQKGSDGPCTTVKPVWNTLAKSLSDNW